MSGTEKYYERRAAEYDQVYAKPERQPDFVVLRDCVARSLAGKRVLEVAAGTGWWTDVLADSAASVTATDANCSTLDVAAGKRSWPATVRFVVADAFDLDAVDGDFDAALVGFFWSHILLDRLDSFVDGLVRRLGPAALVVVVDNRFVAGTNHPVTDGMVTPTATSSATSRTADWPKAALGELMGLRRCDPREAATSQAGCPVR